MILQTRVEQGQVQGLRGGHPEVSVFRGIPYAAPPVGPLRWKPPQMPLPWQGVYQAYDFSSIACQPGLPSGTPAGRLRAAGPPRPQSEDCLTLNLWTPARTPEERLPVYVWIHGGAYCRGSGAETALDGEGLAKRGIVVVTLNYRLGILGFLAHPELSRETPDGVSGNYGLLDILAALHWVQRNIAAFGGDAQRVTLGGQSAGAMLVQWAAASPKSTGLFGQMIQQSGGGIEPALPAEEKPLAWAEKLGVAALHFMGIPSIEQARAVPAQELIARAEQFKASDALKELLPEPCENPFVPVVDGAVLPKGCYQAAQDGTLPELPLLAGSNLGEFGGLFHRSLSGWMQRRRGPTYGYSFDRQIPGRPSGAFHAGELWYVFETLPRCWRPFTGADYELAGKMADYWAAFIKTGDPNGESRPLWPRYQQEENLIHFDVGEI